MNMLFLMNKTKDQISRVSSYDLYWENKMYKRKRSILRSFKTLVPINHEMHSRSYDSYTNKLKKSKSD